MLDSLTFPGALNVHPQSLFSEYSSAAGTKIDSFIRSESVEKSVFAMVFERFPSYVFAGCHSN